MWPLEGPGLKDSFNVKLMFGGKPRVGKFWWWKIWWLEILMVAIFCGGNVGAGVHQSVNVSLFHDIRAVFF